MSILKEIPGLPGYFATSGGDIISMQSRWPSMNGRVLAKSMAGAGYLKVSPNAKTMYVHHLVALAFIGQRAPGMQINHIDGDKRNNRPDNLEYVTASQNGMHAANVLGKHRGEKNGSAKLTPHQVMLIKCDPRRQSLIAKQYKISQSNVSHIKSGKTWNQSRNIK